MKVIVIFLCLSCYTSLVVAQSAMVITMKNDTIVGKMSIISRSPYEMDEMIVKNDDGKHRLTPLQVRRAHRGNESFVPLKIDQKYQFGKVQVEGFLSLYDYINPETKSYEDFSLEILIKKDGSQRKFSRLMFAKTMETFLSECPNIRTRKNNKTLKYNNILKIIEEYNDWVKSPSVIKGNGPRTSHPIDIIILKANEHPKFKDNTELRQMLSDARDKLMDEKDVPDYLINAIEGHLKSDTVLLEQFEKIKMKL